MLYSASVDADEQVVTALEQVAQERGQSLARIALAWLLSRPGVTSPIVGAGKIAHLEDAVGALEVALSEQECAMLERPYRPRATSFYQEVPGSDQDR
jgi:aryl-alcohol dehydrogenase-like predicted oxidoreductase